MEWFTLSLDDKLSQMSKLVFALHASGRVLHVANVKGGLACCCRCLDCDEPLVARKGDIRDHHFGHTSGKEHDWAWETHLHAYAKQLIADAGGLAVPLHEGIARHLQLPETKGGVQLKARASSIRLEATRGDVRPDLVLRLAERDVEIALEILVTHGCAQAKRDEFKRQHLAALEIDLSRFPPHGFDAKKLAEAVLIRTENKIWLWPPPPRPAGSWTPSAQEEPSRSFVQSEPCPDEPPPPRMPMPPAADLQFAVRAWRATVTVSVTHSGMDYIQVQVKDFDAAVADSLSRAAEGRRRRLRARLHVADTHRDARN
jgi:competence protein CoiA